MNKYCRFSTKQILLITQIENNNAVLLVKI